MPKIISLIITLKNIKIQGASRGGDSILKLVVRGAEFYYDSKFSREKIQNYSLKKFRQTVKYAYKYSKFYKKYYSSNGIKYKDLDNIDPKEIPLMSKQLVIENFYDIATRKINPLSIKKALKSKELLPRAGRYFLVHTSGSTGTPCNFLYDRNAIVNLESNFIRLSIGGKNPIGFRDFPIRSVYIAPVGSGYACTALALNGLKAYHAKGIVLDASKPLSEWKSIINNYSPNYLSGYPSCIRMAAELQEEGEIKFKPKKIITGGEPLNHETAVYFSNLFGADIIDYYGCTESILLGAGASWYEGLYLFDDLNYYETDSRNRLIITPLYNKIFPLVRYQLNDMVEGFTKEKYGTLPFTHIDRVVGRNEDIMWFNNSHGNRDFLHPLFLDDLNVKGISKYQFIQQNNESFILKCVKMPYAKDNIENEIKVQIDTFLKKKQMQNIKYKIVFVDNIEVNPHTGKTKLVIIKV